MQGNIERKCCLWQRKERINMDLLGKKVLVAGCGKSGLGAAGLLQKAGAVPVLFDENEKLDGKALCAREDYPKDTALVLGSLPKELLSELSLAVFPLKKRLFLHWKRRIFRYGAKLSSPGTMKRERCSQLQARTERPRRQRWWARS